MELPLFPLNTVLFPGGPLALRIFEPRYLSMVSRCMREHHGFGVVLIEEGAEAGPASFFATGTLAEIVDWSTGHDGLLAIVARGRERFTIVQSRCQADGLYVGELEPLPPEPALAVPERHRRLSRLLAGLIEGSDERYPDIDEHLADATWVGYRLTELLPLPAAIKQNLLELTDAVLRLELLEKHADDVSLGLA